MAKSGFGGGFGKPFKATRPKASKKIEPEWPKNNFGAAQSRTLAIEALRNTVCLAFDYHGCHRIVEVHTVGTSLKDRPSMSVFQVDGQCNDTTIPGWAFFCFDECFNVALTDRPAFPPRPDYSKGAKQFRRIDAEF